MEHNFDIVSIRNFCEWVHVSVQSQNIVRADQGQLQWIYHLAMISTIYSQSFNFDT